MAQETKNAYQQVLINAYQKGFLELLWNSSGFSLGIDPKRKKMIPEFNDKEFVEYVFSVLKLVVAIAEGEDLKDIPQSDLEAATIIYNQEYDLKNHLYIKKNSCNGVQREHNKKLNNGLPILHKVPPKRDYGRYFCILAEKGGTTHGGLTEKLSPFFYAQKQEVNAYGR